MGKIPEWMVCGKTTYSENLSKGTYPTNYQPITCLPNIWKILIGIMSDKTYESIDERVVLAEKQERCKNIRSSSPKWS